MTSTSGDSTKSILGAYKGKIVAATLSLLLLLIPFWSGFEGGGGPMDEGMVLLYPEMIQKGAVPYRDFETFYAPGNPWLLAGVYSTFGTTITVERTTGLVYRVAILLAIFCLTQRRGTAVAVGSTLLSGALLMPCEIIAYAWMAGLACVLWYLWLITSDNLTPVRCVVAGLTAGLALLFRLDLLPALVLASAPLLFFLSWPQRIKVGAGLIIALLPLLVLTAMIGVEPVINNLFVFPVLRANAGRHLPVFSVERSTRILFFVHLLAVAVDIVAGALIAKQQPRRRGNMTLLAMSLVAAAISHQAWQRLDMFHLVLAAFLSLGILPFALTTIASRWCPRSWSNTRIAIAAAVAVALLVAWVEPTFVSTLRSAFSEGLQTKPSEMAAVEKNGRKFWVGSLKTAVMIQQMLDRLDDLSTPGQRIFVGPQDLRRTNYCDTFIYHLMPKLRPATYFLEMNPFSANRPGSRLASDIRTADWVILNRRWDRWEEANRSGENGSDEPNRVVRENFVFVAAYGPYGLFRRRG
ncbi:MAG: hypothetical protein ACJ8M4_08415 [Chthoniobacterales bacterium]